MYSRSISVPEGQSFFLFGPRGTGKSTWVTQQLPSALTIDLLESELYTALLANPQRLDAMIPPGHKGWVVLDEVQRVPELLNEVHRLIEKRKLRFAMTGSSARKLRRQGTNLLAGRALTLSMFPLTCSELGDDFDLLHSLSFGNLPATFATKTPRAFLASYVATYLREEVQMEGLARNLGAFSRFLEAASFSQGCVLNISAVAADCSVGRKVVEDYFAILEDLMIGLRLPVFARRAKRKVNAHPKFYFFDPGVYRAIRPRGPLDRPDEIDGPALETLILHELRANNANFDLGYQLFYWRTAAKVEVDFVLYGEKGLLALEVKRAARIRADDLAGLRAFLEDYPMARARLIYGGLRRYHEGNIEIVPAETAIREMPAWMSTRDPS